MENVSTADCVLLFPVVHSYDGKLFIKVACFVLSFIYRGILYTVLSPSITGEKWFVYATSQSRFLTPVKIFLFRQIPLFP